MMQLLLIVALVGFLFYHLKIKHLPKSEQQKMIVRSAITLGAAALILGALTGRVHWLGGVVAAGIAFMRSGLITGLHLGRFWMAKTGGIAQFSTEHLAATFNANTLQIEGRIKKGLYASQQLQQLSEDQLQELMAYYQEHDTKSYYLIRAFRQRRGFGGAQQETFVDTGSPAIGEALDILGLQGKPSREDIIAAHRRLINKLHPDRGGSDYLASQVNLARDQLLKHLEKDA